MHTSLVDFFDLVLVINLPERTDRLRAVRHEFARVGWRLGPGGVEVFPAHRFDEAAGFPTGGVRGCFHSHLGCLRRALAEGVRHVLIFEDDIALSSALPRLAPPLLDRLADGDWDVAYFGYDERQPVPVASRSAREVEFRRFDGELMGAHFYAVHGPTLPRLIEHLELTAAGSRSAEGLVPMPYDGALYEFRRRHSDVVTLIAAPQLGWQRPSRSDLTPRGHDASRWLEPIIAFAREVKYLAMRRGR